MKQEDAKKEAQRILHAPEAQQLLALLSRGGGQTLQQAAAAAQRGDMAGGAGHAEAAAGRPAGGRSAGKAEAGQVIGTENLEEKLSQVLNDPNSMAQLMSFAQSLGMGPPDAPPPPGPPPGPSPGPPPGDDAFVRGILQLVRQANQKDGPQEALLAVLKPYLRPDRREKLDRAMRIARISQIAGGALKQHGGLLGGPNDV